MLLRIMKLCDSAVIPKNATSGSAGMDLYACTNEDIVIEPGKRVLVPTGLAIALESADYVAYIFARSGLAVKSGITLTNCVGVIDSDYRGELKVALINHSDQTYVIKNGERIAQLVIAPFLQVAYQEQDELSETVRGTGGFGSTGTK
jgi:dUTP pyrophosphatase